MVTRGSTAAPVVPSLALDTHRTRSLSDLRLWLKQQRVPGFPVMLVPLSSPQQGEGEEDRGSSSSDSDSEEVTSPPALCWGLALPAPQPCGVCSQIPGMGHSALPSLLSLFFLFLPQDQGIAKDDEKEDED